jgi:hypothetical protein
MLVRSYRSVATTGRAQWAADDPEDVLCSVKTYMRDTTLQQPPVVALLASRCGWVVEEEPTKVLCVRPLTAGEVESYVELADICDNELGLSLAEGNSVSSRCKLHLPEVVFILKADGRPAPRCRAEGRTAPRGSKVTRDCTVICELLRSLCCAACIDIHLLLAATQLRELVIQALQAQ